MAEIEQPQKQALYTSLLHPRSIRLLTILPGAGDTDIYCELQTCTLDDAPPYKALSYVWGNPNPPAHIICNGFSRNVTPNLAGALRRLRRDDGLVLRRVWVDALCINQDDLAERSQQVAFMRDIYAQAVEVIVWLGEDDDNRAGAALDIVRTAAQICYQEVGSSFEKIGQLPNATFEYYSHKFPSFSSSDWADLNWFYARPWFRRIWVLQEACHFQVCAIIGSHPPFPFDNFMAAGMWLLSKLPSYFLKSREIQLHGALQHWGAGRARFRNLPLWIQITFACEASDPRDKIYALLGFLIDKKEELSIDPLLQPDYNKTVRQVYKDTAEYLILSPEKFLPNLWLLSQIWVMDGEDISPFPAWMPRWDRVNYLGPTLQVARKEGKFLASLDLPVELQRGTGPDNLVMKGLIVSKIVYTRPLFVKDPDEDARSYHREALEYMTEKLQEFPPKTEEIKDIFTRTVTACYPRSAETEEPFRAQDLDEFLAQGTPDLDKDDRFTKAARLLYRVFVTDNGYLGSEKHRTITKPGDVVCVFFGGNTPFLLRPEGDHFGFIAECYVDGLMNGEAVEMWRKGELEDMWIDLR